MSVHSIPEPCITTCDRCGEDLEMNRPDEDVDREAELLFGMKDATNRALKGELDLICGDCFKKYYVAG